MNNPLRKRDNYSMIIGNKQGSSERTKYLELGIFLATTYGRSEDLCHSCGIRHTVRGGEIDQ